MLKLLICFHGVTITEDNYFIHHGAMTNRGVSTLTGFPSLASTSTIVPDRSDSISFINFMASTMQRTWPFWTTSPSFTKGGAPGAGQRYNVPAIGHFIGGWDDFGFAGLGSAGAETGGEGAGAAETGAAEAGALTGAGGI